MNRRLQQFLGAENISQSQFADSIGVARASVSHILAGRNKPGFDFILSMAKAYPALNVDWLITGKGRMYKTSTDSTAIKSDNYDDLPDLFDEESGSASENVSQSRPARDETLAGSNRIESDTSIDTINIPNNKHNITKVIIYFDDNTYQELR